MCYSSRLKNFLDGENVWLSAHNHIHRNPTLHDCVYTKNSVAVSEA